MTKLAATINTAAIIKIIPGGNLGGVCIRCHFSKSLSEHTRSRSEADALQKMLDERTHAGLKVTADTLGGPYRFFFGFSSGEKDARRLT